MFWKLLQSYSSFRGVLAQDLPQKANTCELLLPFKTVSVIFILLIYILIFFIKYFLVIKPQNK